MRGLLKAALDAGNEVTIKKKGKKKTRVAKPSQERMDGRGLDAYSPPRKRKNRMAQGKIK